MSVPPEKVEAEIAKAFEEKPRRLKVSGELLSNDHTDAIDGLEVDFEFGEKPEPPLTEYSPP